MLLGGTVVGVDVAAEEAALRICRALGTTWLISGAYQRVDDRVRITARVLAVETGAVVDTLKVDGVLEDLFSLQDQVVNALGTQLGTGAPVPTPTGRSGAPTLMFDGPPPPVAPEVITRDERHRATVRAVRLTAPLVLDGRLDEAAYTRVLPMSDFIQQEPQEGSPATEKTEAWMFFDDDRVYVSFRCWESEPERMIVNEMRRDNFNVYQNDHVAFVIDTFYDRRNGLEFLVNPVGGRMDGQITDERLYNGDWNPIWDVAVGRFDGGWTLETAIPFKSLRYRRGSDQLWGFNVRRVNVWKNEHSFLVGIPNALGASGILQFSRAATVVGLEVPPRATNLDVKPFAITDLTSDRTATPPVSNALGGDVGLDVKYGVTQNLVADVTVNTDFAQVEADDQQVNLTRFSLFFPEKREFFLENQGVFAFGGAGTGALWWRCHDARPVLQPPNRFARGASGAHHGGWPAHWPGGQVQCRCTQHPDGRPACRGPGGDELHGHAGEARPAATEQHRRDLHRALGVNVRRRVERNVWCRRHVRVLRQPPGQHVLGQNPDARTLGGRRQPPGPGRLRGRPLWSAGRAARRRGQLQSPRWGSSNAMTSNAVSGSSGLARGRSRSPPSAS